MSERLIVAVPGEIAFIVTVASSTWTLPFWTSLPISVACRRRPGAVSFALFSVAHAGNEALVTCIVEGEEDSMLQSYPASPRGASSSQRVTCAEDPSCRDKVAGSNVITGSAETAPARQTHVTTNTIRIREFLHILTPMMICIIVRYCFPLRRLMDFHANRGGAKQGAEHSGVTN